MKEKTFQTIALLKILIVFQGINSMGSKVRLESCQLELDCNNLRLSQ